MYESFFYVCIVLFESSQCVVIAVYTTVVVELYIHKEREMKVRM